MDYSESDYSITDVPTSIYHFRYQSLRAAMVSARKASGLTQVQLAEKLAVGQSYVSKIERGESYVDITTYIDWCVACGTKPGVMLDALLEDKSAV